MRRVPRSILRFSLILAIVGPIVCGVTGQLGTSVRASEIVQTQERLKAEADRLFEQGIQKIRELDDFRNNRKMPNYSSKTWREEIGRAHV